MAEPPRDDQRRDMTDGGYRDVSGSGHSVAVDTPPQPLDGLVARTLAVTTLLLLGAGMVFLLGVFLWAQMNDGRVVLYTDLYQEMGIEIVLLYAVVTPVISVGLALITLQIDHST